MTRPCASSQAAAFDEEEIAAAEEALRLAEELDQAEEQEVSEREKADLELAREVLAADESTEAVRPPAARPMVASYCFLLPLNYYSPPPHDRATPLPCHRRRAKGTS